jgi:hypothetical protein
MFLFIKKDKLMYIIWALVFGLAAYLFYHSYRIIVPLAFLPFPFFVKGRNTKVVTLFAVFVLFAATIGIGLTGQGAGRFNQVAFYNDKSLENTIETLQSGEGRNNVLVARIFHNKAVIYARDFAKQYSSYFSPHFLFEDKGLPARYATPEQGLLYYMLIPFLLAALVLYISFSDKNNKAWYIFYILALAVLPAALTNEDSPNISRSSVMILPFVVVGAFGAYAFFTRVKKGVFKKILLCQTEGISTEVIIERSDGTRAYKIFGSKPLKWFDK